MSAIEKIRGSDEVNRLERYQEAYEKALESDMQGYVEALINKCSATNDHGRN